jgi:hypothetical protein
MNALTFQDTAFEVIERAGQPWLRGLQVASALGYENPTADILNLYTRNADEFTDSMTALVELDTAGGKQQVRIFSLRGAHLLGMFARTAKAAEFRRWVLDVLDHQAAPPAPPPKPGPRGAFPCLNVRLPGFTANEYTAHQAATLSQHLLDEAANKASIPAARIAMYTACISLLDNAVQRLRDETDRLKQRMEGGMA